MKKRYKIDDIKQKMEKYCAECYTPGFCHECNLKDFVKTFETGYKEKYKGDISVSCNECKHSLCTMHIFEKHDARISVFCSKKPAPRKSMVFELGNIGIPDDCPLNGKIEKSEREKSVFVYGHEESFEEWVSKGWI